MTTPLAWGAHVSSAFRSTVRAIAVSLLLPPDGASWLMACMSWESGNTFMPTIRNAAGSGAVGLIQFMPYTAVALGTTVAELAELTAEQQLEYVDRYFLPYKGRLQLLSDTYMAILWPAAIGKPDTDVLWDKGTRPTTYRQNSGLDANTDDKITKGEAAARVAARLVSGLLPGNFSL